MLGRLALFTPSTAATMALSRLALPYSNKSAARPNGRGGWPPARRRVSSHHHAKRAATPELSARPRDQQVTSYGIQSLCMNRPGYKLVPTSMGSPVLSASPSCSVRSGRCTSTSTPTLQPLSR
jgi:hypothetical protein